MALTHLAEVVLPNAALTGIVDFEKQSVQDLKREQNSQIKENPSYPIMSTK